MTPGRCYIDGHACDCEGGDVCPNDEYAHDDELMTEDDIDAIYEARSLAMKEQNYG